MPDLDNPTRARHAHAAEVLPHVGQLPFGAPDAERRGAIAEWMTENPWFATALVNRMWAELVGEGFYEPIDDIGPDRTPSAPKTVEFLSRRFAESGYDVKWLFRVICATEAYQRESRPRREADGTPFVANVAQPLRSDQLYQRTADATDGAGIRRRAEPPRPAASHGTLRPRAQRSATV